MKEESVILAAQKRAAIISVLTNAKQPMPSYLIFKAPEIKKFDFTWAAFQTFMSAMKNSQLVYSKKIDDPKARVGYFPFNGSTESGEKKVAKKQKVKAVSIAPNLKIDIIKSTGRVRLELNGLFIEIGVIE